MTFQPWRTAWHQALYGIAGFYTGPEGPAGHFATSAQGIPGVSEILAQALLAIADEEGAEIIVDFACGRGELLSTLSEFDGNARHLIGVDVVPRPSALDPHIEWIQSPGAGRVPSLKTLAGRRALVLAHEWLDVVPCDIVEIDDTGTPRQVLVDQEGTEALGAPSATLPPWHCEPNVRHSVGTRIEVSTTRDDAWRALVDEVSQVAGAGSCILGVDYATTATNAPPLGTLTGFRHGAECFPIPDGSCDITSHVVLDGLDLSEEPRRQRGVLRDLFGEAPLHPVPISLASEDPPKYLERLATRSAFATATAHDGLGDFFWFLRRT